MLLRLPVKIIVDADDVVAILEQTFAQMRAQKAGAAGYQYLLHSPFRHPADLVRSVRAGPGRATAQVAPDLPQTQMPTFP